MKYKLFYLPVAILMFLTGADLSAVNYREVLLLDGSEKVLKFGMDTTSNWWAVTEPFAKKVRLTVNGNSSEVYTEIRNLTFSPDGSRWACFAKDESQWFFMSSDTIIEIIARASPVSIQFTPDSQDLLYSYSDERTGYLISSKNQKSVLNFAGKVYLNYDGSRLAYTVQNGKQTELHVKGMKFPPYDDIRIIGFWYDGNIIYAAKNVDTWEIFKGSKSISEQLKEIKFSAVNLSENAAAVAFVNTRNQSCVMLISDEYYEPLTGNLYDNISNLVLHPYLPLAAYCAQLNGTNYLVYSSTEYPCGLSVVKPKFSADGSELYYVGDNSFQFLNINGVNHNLDLTLANPDNIALKPGTKYLAYTEETSLVVKNLDSRRIMTGRLMDKLSPPRYNRFNNSFESLGLDGNKLYLLKFEY